FRRAPAADASHGTLEQAGPSAGRTTMRNSLLMGVTVSALAFWAVPASAQVTVGGQVTVQRHQDDERDRPDSDYDVDDDQGSDSSYGPYPPAGFGVQAYGGGSANEYGSYAYPECASGGLA